MNNLTSIFKNTISQQGWNLPGKKTLLAVSGGKDSMALAHLFLTNNIPHTIAHCNFRLRGSQSDEDQLFIENYCKQNNIPFHSKEFDTEKIANLEKLSIQVVARNLRYDWFNQLALQHNFDFIATAHHLNDNIETLLFNLIKGTGLKGLLGIPIQNKRIIRPLLQASATHIQAFIDKHQIVYREDSSNAKTNYSRNKLRHQVIPVLKEINPGLENTMLSNFTIFQKTAALLSDSIEKEIKTLCHSANGLLYIQKHQLSQHQHNNLILFEILQPFGFNGDQVNQIIASLEGASGKLFYSTTHRLEVGRSALILQKISQEDSSPIFIKKEDKQLSWANHIMKIERLEVSEICFTENTKVATLNADKLKFPLELRKWRTGDKFCPLGLNGKHQSLQDFFTHQKLSRTAKEKVWLLCTNDQIVWVLNYRIDERFKITADTKNAIRFSLK